MDLHCLCAYLISTYKKTLVREANAWWLAGAVGQKRGMRLLEVLMRFAKAIPLLQESSMRSAARAKAAVVSKSSPQEGGVCFVGSSTFTYWTHLEEDMRVAGVKQHCWNAAFGGSSSHQVLNHMDELVVRWKPRVVVYFCGTNDLNLLPGAPRPAENFILFVERLRKALLTVRVVYLAPTITPFVLWRGPSYVQRFDDLTSRMREEIEEARFPLDAAECVSSGNFMSIPELYLGDGHHLNISGHASLARLLAPAVQRAMMASTKDGPK